MKTYNVKLTESMLHTIDYAMQILLADYSALEGDSDFHKQREKEIKAEIQAVDNAILKAKIKASK